MCEQMTLLDTANAISSPVWPDGLLPFASHGLPALTGSGQAARHAKKTLWAPQSTAGASALTEPVADSPTPGLISSKRGARKASASKTSRASARGLPRSPAVWDSLATEYADPNDRLRMLVRRIYAGESGLLPTLVARDFRSPGDPNHPRRSATRGQPLPETFSSPIPAELARWMMGFPVEWAQCMPTEMPSTPGPRQKRSKQP